MGLFSVTVQISPYISKLAWDACYVNINCYCHLIIFYSVVVEDFSVLCEVFRSRSKGTFIDSLYCTLFQMKGQYLDSQDLFWRSTYP